MENFRAHFKLLMFFILLSLKSTFAAGSALGHCHIFGLPGHFLIDSFTQLYQSPEACRMAGEKKCIAIATGWQAKIGLAKGIVEILDGDAKPHKFVVESVEPHFICLGKKEPIKYPSRAPSPVADPFKIKIPTKKFEIPKQDIGRDFRTLTEIIRALGVVAIVLLGLLVAALAAFSGGAAAVPTMILIIVILMQAGYLTPSQKEQFKPYIAAAEQFGIEIKSFESSDHNIWKSIYWKDSSDSQRYVSIKFKMGWEKEVKIRNFIDAIDSNDLDGQQSFSEIASTKLSTKSFTSTEDAPTALPRITQLFEYSNEIEGLLSVSMNLKPLHTQGTNHTRVDSSAAGSE